MQEKMKKNTENRRKRAKKGNSTREEKPDIRHIEISKERKGEKGTR